MLYKISRRITGAIISYTEKNSFKLVAGTIVFFFLLFFIVRIASVFLVGPDTWGIMENNVIYAIQRMLGGLPLYGDPEQPPFAVIQYSPVYYYIIYGICHLIGVGPNDLLEIYQVSRVVSLFFNILFATFSGAIAYHFLKSRKTVFVLVSMFAFIVLQRHGFSRPDSIFNATVISSIFCFMWYIENSMNGKRKLLPLLLTAFSVVLCIFSKQSGVILPVLLFFYQLFFLKKYKDFLLLALLMGIFSGIFFLLLAGDSPLLFYNNVVRGLDNGISLLWFWYNIVVFYFGTVTGLLFTILCLFGSLFLIRLNDHRLAFMGWSMLGLFAFATLTALKHGSTPSYYTEVCALAIVSYLCFKSSIRLPGFIQVTGMFLLLTAMLMKPKVLGPLNNVGRYSKESFLQEKEVEKYISDNLPLHLDEVVFLDLNAWEYFLPGIYFEKGLFPQKDIVGQKISFDYSGFSKLKTEGKIKVVITRNDEVEYLGVSFDDYILVKEINGFKILRRPV